MDPTRIRWQSSEGAATTTLTIRCNDDGTVEMSTPQDQGGFHEEYTSPAQATQGLDTLLKEGIQEAKR